MPKIKLSRAKRKGPHRAGRSKPNTFEYTDLHSPPSKETQAQYRARVEREGKPPFGPISKANKPNILATARKCECERDCHFLSIHDGSHAYGAEMPDVQPVKTPFATLQACTYCRDNCLAIYNTPLANDGSAAVGRIVDQANTGAAPPCARCGAHRDANIHLAQNRRDGHEYTIRWPEVPTPPMPCDHVAPRKGCSYCQQRLRTAEEALDLTTKLLLGGNVADYFEAALDAVLGKDYESLADCPLISICGFACKEAIDSARVLYRSACMHLGEESDVAGSVRETALKICQVIYCG